MDANYKRIPFVQRLARFAFLTPILNGLWLAVPFLCLVDSDAFWVYLVAAFLIFSPKISFMFLSYLCPVLMCVTVFSSITKAPTSAPFTIASLPCGLSCSPVSFL